MSGLADTTQFSGNGTPAYQTPVKDMFVTRGAPDPIIIRYRAGSTLVALDSSLTFTFVYPDGTVTLGVGTGITLSTDEGIANGRATVQLTVAQSRLIPVGPLTRYEVQRLNGGLQDVILMGRLVGEGGDNPDV
jgi:hypothetical protein